MKGSEIIQIAAFCLGSRLFRWGALTISQSFAIAIPLSGIETWRTEGRHAARRGGT